MTTPTFIRVNIIGYGGVPASLLCALDTSTGMLRVSDDREIEPGGRPGWLLITNSVSDESADAFFRRDMLRDAIAAFFDMDSVGLVSLASKAVRADPRSKIEADGIDERGTKYRIKSDCGNRQVAVLAACWFAQMQLSISDSIDLMRGVDSWVDWDGADAVIA